MLAKLFLSVLLFTVCQGLRNCNAGFSTKCSCGVENYLGKQQYIVNCTNSGFSNAELLSKLPDETQVLIFTGNNLTELPLNVFGTHNNSNLRIIDLSNNHIQTIRGKSFHHVSNVERLILNFNEISISSDDPVHHHPRIFSNFENLLELHLTDAFADNSPEGLAADLHDIFFSSELSKLRKLHLEQNEISQFQDDKVFCDLTSLQDLHLGQNALSGIHFKLSCLLNLRYLDLEQNLIYSLSETELKILDAFPERNQTLMVNIIDNPLTCNCDQLYSWLKNTKVNVLFKNKLHCRRSLQNRSQHCMSKLSFSPILVEPKYDNLFLVTVLLVLLIISISFHVYTHKKFLKDTFTPAVHAVTKKVHYTTIGKQEEPEMDV